MSKRVSSAEALESWTKVRDGCHAILSSKKDTASYVEGAKLVYQHLPIIATFIANPEREEFKCPLQKQ